MIKRLLSAILCLIWIPLFPLLSVSASAAVFHSDVRVLLSTGKVRELSVTLTGEYYVKENPSLVLTDVTVRFSVTGSRPILTVGGITEAEALGEAEETETERFTASSITLVSADYGGFDAYFTLENSNYDYLGNLTISVSEGALRFINTLPTEQYLYGVVPHEMSNTFPLEALKAQAICARGYAVARCSSYASRAYDLVDTSSDQVYRGYAPEYTRAIAAVDETYGQVLTYEGEIVETYYSASNGGQTEKTGNVWRSDFPYYVHQDDIYDLLNPSSLSESSFIPAVFTENTLALMDDIVLQALRQGANAAAGETVTLLSTVRVKAHSAKYDPPSRCYTKADVTLMVETASGQQGQVTVTLDLESFIASNDNPSGVFNLNRTLRVRGAEPGVFEQEDGTSDTGWYLTNRRWGHGVGLSQRGAQQRATSGQLLSEILAFYYVNTAITTVGDYDSAPALTSEVYRISSTCVDNIKPGTKIADFLAALHAEGAEIRLISASGSVREAAEGATVRTGDYVRMVYDGGSTYLDIPLVIYGDLNGDGKIDASDVDSLCNHLLSVKVLTGAYLLAADINHDGMCDIQDALLLQKYVQGAYSIEQGGPEV